MGDAVVGVSVRSFLWVSEVVGLTYAPAIVSGRLAQSGLLMVRGEGIAGLAKPRVADWDNTRTNSRFEICMLTPCSLQWDMRVESGSMHSVNTGVQGPTCFRSESKRGAPSRTISRSQVVAHNIKHPA